MLKCDPQYMRGVDTGGGGGGGVVWGLKDPTRFSGSTLYLLGTMVDLYQN